MLSPEIRSKHRLIYLVVYTETDAHLNRYICGGGLDLGLNQKGMDEARQLSRRFKKNPLKLKKIMGSPELRAVQMADIMHDEIKVKMSLLSGLADQNMGECEGLPLDQFLNQAFDFKNPPRGETETEFFKRVDSTLESLLLTEEKSLVVTHLRVARRLLKILGIENEVIVPGEVFCIDLPMGHGLPHLRLV